MLVGPLEANLVPCLMFDVDGDGGESLVAEWDRESRLGVETGDNVGGVGEFSRVCWGIFCLL